MSGKLFIVDVTVMGHVQIPVSAATLEEAQEKAADCASVFSVNEWEYHAFEAQEIEPVGAEVEEPALANGG